MDARSEVVKTKVLPAVSVWGRSYGATLTGVVAHTASAAASATADCLIQDRRAVWGEVLRDIDGFCR